MSPSLHRGVCCVCGSETIIYKTIPSLGKFCYTCNLKRLKDSRPKVVIKIRPVGGRKKPTGEKELFEKIWNERPHVSFINGEPLGNEAMTWFFMHVLPKSTHEEFRLLDDNIVLGTEEQHKAWDQQSREKIKDKPEWRKMFALEAELDELYNVKHRHTQ